ncbi:MAG: thiamine phosphate synthase [Alphaproteobacteria bacterium]|nr:thiamine phosphate synthase [Alphaproteobacteria bacterium]
MRYNLYAITDYRWDTQTMLDKVEKAVAGGIDVLQYRPKNIETLDMIKQAGSLQEIITPHNIPLIINDAVDVAKTVDADGVHLGQNDMKAKSARDYLGNSAIIGLSVGNMQELKNLDVSVVDYVGIGAVYETGTKSNAGKPIGVDGFKALRDKILIPCVAIGGITLNNAKALIDNGSDGIAVISGLFETQDITETAINFKNLYNKK